jgi:ketosteroid isomerase-like protein
MCRFQNMVVSLLVIFAGLPAARAADRTAVLVDLMRVDSEFNALSQRVGRSEAFLSYMADDAVLINRATRGKAEARESFARTDVKGLRLIWGATYSDASAAGDLGYTLGVWQRETPAEGTATLRTSTGMFLTIWKRQSDGAWKFVIDGIGNVIAPEQLAIIHRSMRTFPSPAAYPSPVSRLDRNAAEAQVRKVESMLSQQSVLNGQGTALLPHLSMNALLLDQAVYSKPAAMAALREEAANKKATLEPISVNVADSADLAYTWGWRRADDRVQGQPPMAGNAIYLNVWKRQADGSWQIVVTGSAEHSVEEIQRLIRP